MLIKNGLTQSLPIDFPVKMHDYRHEAIPVPLYCAANHYIIRLLRLIFFAARAETLPPMNRQFLR
ncbi:hypothetical protein D0N73_11315 [Pseudomonas fluorescens]|nr:hypothetical protein B0A76_12760 [Pseudomonas fluorescens]RFP96019.1 hypothetical protein D0N73_11315 [Pseudomonas fluorescens]